MKPTLALVQGDAAGIGPELLAKLLALEEVRKAANIVIFDDKRIFEEGCRIAEIKPPIRQIATLKDLEFSANSPNLFDMGGNNPKEVSLGTVSAKTGTAVLNGLGQAIDACTKGLVDAVCFMPFNKASMHEAGLEAEDELRWVQKRIEHTGWVSEFNVIDGMWNARVTSHIPLREVADTINETNIVGSLELAHATLRDAGFSAPKIAVAAINPHAGDNGQIGREEIEVIGPAVKKAQQMGISCEGPFPCDTLYIKVRDGEYDCALSMYHDQGQIAIKLLGFHMGVSVLSGLPFPLTTPAHGTAFDIVGQNRANVEPSRRAFLMGVQMAKSR